MRRIIPTRAPTRRGLLAAAAGLAAAGAVARPAGAATTVPEAATLMCPGPEDGPTAAFAARAARGLSRGLVQAAALRVAVLGGPDGITAANRFAASAAPDGRALLVLPGLATHALLVGDSRARFEPRHWPAVAAAILPAVLAGRGALSDRTPVRIAMPGPGAAETAGLLALDLLGRPAVPVVPPAGMTAEAAVQQGLADVLVMTGPSLPARAAGIGLAPWLAFDIPGVAREAELAGVPGLADALPDPAQPALLAGLRAAGAATRCRGVVVLPALTGADSVALWRGAAQRWTEAETDGLEPGARHATAGDAARLLGALCPSTEASLAYREWLLRRLGWQSA